MFSWVTKTAQSTYVSRVLLLLNYWFPCRHLAHCIWLTPSLASVAGTAEPIYGPEALQPVTVQEDQNPKYEFDSKDVKWLALDSTCAETETFYIEADSGHYVMIQVIYSNVA